MMRLLRGMPAGVPFRHPAGLLATWFGAGLIRGAPGTWGSLAALPPAERPDGTSLTLYSSLEPCTSRRSRPVPCAALVVEAGISRVVLAAREPDLFADCRGVADLRAAGVDVVEVEELAGLVRAVNSHLPAWAGTGG